MEYEELITEYPLFLPSDKLADKGRVNWTKKEAKEFFDWYISEIPERVFFLLNYIDLKNIDLKTVNSKILDELHTKVLRKLNESKALTELNKEGIKELTNEGYGFLVDVASLFSTIILNEYPELEFTIATGKSNVYYNWPVIEAKLKKRTGLSFIMDDIRRFYVRIFHNNEERTLKEFYNGPIKNRFRFLKQPDV
jgi:hypothetical protein